MIDDPFPPPRSPEQPSPSTVELRRLARAASQAFGRLLPGVPGYVRFVGRRARTDVVIALGEVASELDGVAAVPSSYPAAKVTSTARRAMGLACAEMDRPAIEACDALLAWGEAEERRQSEEAIRRHAEERRSADGRAPELPADKRTKAIERARSRV